VLTANKRLTAAPMARQVIERFEVFMRGYIKVF
jgi:hypothetical protein